MRSFLGIPRPHWTHDAHSGVTHLPPDAGRRESTLLEVLLDLGMVALVQQLSGTLGNRNLGGDEWTCVLAFLGLGVPLFTNWVMSNLYSNLFDAQNIGDALYFFVNMACLLGASGNVQTCSDHLRWDDQDLDCGAISVFLIIQRAAFVIMLLRGSRFAPDARPYAVFVACINVASLAFWMGVGLTSSGSTGIVLIVVGVVWDVVLRNILLYQMQWWDVRAPPVDATFMHRRISLLVVLMIGSVMTASVSWQSQTSFNPREEKHYYWTMCAGITFGFLIYMMFFVVLDAVGRDADEAAFVRRPLLAPIFVYAHVPLVLCLGNAGDYIERVQKSNIFGDTDEISSQCDDCHVDVENRTLFLWAVSVLCLLIGGLRVMHRRPHNSLLDPPLWICISGAGLLIGLAFAPDGTFSPLNILHIANAVLLAVTVGSGLAIHYGEPLGARYALGARRTGERNDFTSSLMEGGHYDSDVYMGSTTDFLYGNSHDDHLDANQGRISSVESTGLAMALAAADKSEDVHIIL